jgi:hypothetical protein
VTDSLQYEVRRSAGRCGRPPDSGHAWVLQPVRVRGAGPAWRPAGRADASRRSHRRAWESRRDPRSLRNAICSSPFWTACRSRCISRIARAGSSRLTQAGWAFDRCDALVREVACHDVQKRVRRRRLPGGLCHVLPSSPVKGAGLQSDGKGRTTCRQGSTTR